MDLTTPLRAAVGARTANARMWRIMSAISVSLSTLLNGGISVLGRPSPML